LSAGDVGDRTRRSTGNVDSLQFGLQPVDKRDRPAVGRPEWLIDVFCSLQRAHFD
jgi:hypothetical protein